MAPAVPPLSNAKDDAVNCASQVAMRTIVKPHIVRKRKLRYTLVKTDPPIDKGQETYLRLLRLAHALHIVLVRASTPLLRRQRVAESVCIR